MNWGIFGCIELYKLTKASERKDYIQSKRACLDCGNFLPRIKPNNKPHSCYWNIEKFAIKCTGVTNDKSCPKPAALCTTHKAPDNATSELKAWLAKHSIKFTVGVVISGNIVSSIADPQDYIEEFIGFAQPLTGSVQ